MRPYMSVLRFRVIPLHAVERLRGQAFERFARGEKVVLEIQTRATGRGRTKYFNDATILAL